MFHPKKMKRAKTNLERHYREAWQSFPHHRNVRLLSRLKSTKVSGPIFLLGTQSGGLTLLARCLRRHHEVVYCSGNSRFWAGRDEMQNIGSEFLPDSLVLSRDKAALPGKPAEFGRLATHLYAIDELIDSHRIENDSVRDRDVLALKRLVETYVGTYGLFKTNPRFVDKSQSYSLKVPVLKAAFPDAKFVVVTRNPFAIASSRSRDQHLDWARANCSRELDTASLLRMYAQHWRNSFATIGENLNRDEFLHIKLEDFLNSPEPILREVLTFCELDFQSHLLPSKGDRLPFGSLSGEKWFPLQKEPNESSLAKLSFDDRELIRAELRGVEKFWGY